MKILYIQGIASEEAEQKIDIDKIYNYPNKIALFTTYAKSELNINDRLIINGKEFVFIAGSFGFSEIHTVIPQGYKAVIVVTGRVDDITSLRNELEVVDKWNQSQEDIPAYIR